MTPQELVQYQQMVADKHSALIAISDNFDIARVDAESVDHQSDVVAEATLLRAFTAYESLLEQLFFHYVTGNVSLQGRAAVSYLAAESEEHARSIVRRGIKFLSWAKPSTTTETARLYIENGWPVVDMVSTKSQKLADCERVRNRIAHMSVESTNEFNIVQRNLLRTERLFPIMPEQLLRIRHPRQLVSHLRRFMDVMNETIVSTIDPPP